MGYDTIHETSIRDIAEFIKDGKSAIEDTMSRSSDVGHYSSLTKATKGLVMEFPVLVSKANHIESAGIVAKAYEAKFVTLLQMAFSAYSITHAKDALEYIRQFHTNIDTNITVDEYIKIMDIKENSDVTVNVYNGIKAVMEDMKNLSYYFEDDINESSLNSYKVMKNYGNIKVVKENINNPADDMTDNTVDSNTDTSKTDASYVSKQNSDKQKDEELKLKVDRDKREKLNSEREILMNNLLSSDVKKANELTPTMMIINFNQKTSGGEIIKSNVIIGVKAKLYEVEPTDVINKLITKHVDNNFLLKLVKVSTREISFVKDFLLAIDDAKLSALSKSKRGSTNKLFKVLERRALGGKIRRNLKQKDYVKAISSLVISQEEAEELLKNNIDVSNPRVIRPIMEKLNLISFAIIDESSESVKFLFDTGDDSYETIPLSKLEREQKDGMSKKVINLMAKMNR